MEAPGALVEHRGQAEPGGRFGAFAPGLRFHLQILYRSENLVELRWNSRKSLGKVLTMTTRNFFFRGSALCAIGLIALSGARAQSVVGDASGVFLNPQPGTAISSGVGTNCFAWGIPFASGGSPNTLLFEGNSFASLMGEDFALGTLSYYNGTIFAGTEAASVDLSVGVNLYNPAAGSQTSNVMLSLASTPNIGSPNGDADFVYLPSTFPQNFFSVDGTDYQLEVTGFRNVIGDGFLDSDATKFQVREGGTASAQLFARLVQSGKDVPEPTTAALTLLTLPALCLLRRRKR